MSTSRMAKEDRLRLLLSYLDSRNVYLPPRVWYDNMCLDKDVTFQFRTAENLIREARERGFVERIEQFGTPYYRVTDHGRAFIRGELDDTDADT